MAAKRSSVERLDAAFKRDVLPRRFCFDRSKDATGVSGVGIVAYGVMWEDGTVAVRWCAKHRSTAVYASMADVEAIHGHDGRTRMVWLDDEATYDELVGSDDAPYGELDDGFGSVWPLCREDCGLQIVRPGKVQCTTSERCTY